jgi:peptide/nickel transport system substrate-binding protein
MKQHIRVLAAAGGLLIGMFAAEPVFAQRQGGILKTYSPDSPASMSIHDEATAFAEKPMMGVFNNLVMFDQHVKQNSLASIVPDLATGWSWNEDGTELTFSLRQGISWHDGKPFTARDVQCTWDMLTGKSSEKLRLNPRKDWYRNLEGLSTSRPFWHCSLRGFRQSILATSRRATCAVIRLAPARSNSSNSSRMS